VRYLLEGNLCPMGQIEKTTIRRMFPKYSCPSTSLPPESVIGINDPVGELLRID